MDTIYIVVFNSFLSSKAIYMRLMSLCYYSAKSLFEIYFSNISAILGILGIPKLKFLWDLENSDIRQFICT